MLKDRFLRGSALLFAAMMVGNVFGYLFQLAMGRMLSVADYGEMNALMSLMAMFGIPLAAMVNFFARETSIYFSKGDSSSIRGLHRYGLIKTCWIAAFVICPLALLSPVIGRYIDVSFDKVVLVFICVFIGALTMVNTGVIQGMQYFRGLSFIGAGASFFKFAFAIVFVWLGWGVLGALGGLLATGLTLLVYSQWLIFSSLPHEKKAFHFSFGKIYKYAGGLFLANAFFGVLTQVDVMLVKHYFTPQEAGLYASAAILGKAVMYLPGAIVLAMFPMVAANQAAGQSSSGMLLKAIGLTLALSGSGAVVLHFFPGVIMETLFGARYLPAAPLTAIFGLAMLPMAVILVLMYYLLAQSRLRFVVFLAVAASLELAGIHFFHNNLENILYVIMGAGCVALFFMFFFYILWPYWTGFRGLGKQNER